MSVHGDSVDKGFLACNFSFNRVRILKSGYASTVVRYHTLAGVRNTTVDRALFLEKAVSFPNHRLSIFLSLDSYSKYTPGFKAFTVVTMKNAIFWDVAPCSPVEIYFFFF